MKNRVTVTIAGQEYTLVGSEEPSYTEKVAAHVESPAGVIVALENGVDSIEHGAEPTEEMMALFHSTGACHVATFSPAVPYALFAPAESRQDNGRS